VAVRRPAVPPAAGAVVVVVEGPAAPAPAAAAEPEPTAADAVSPGEVAGTVVATSDWPPAVSEDASSSAAGTAAPLSVDGEGAVVTPAPGAVVVAVEPRDAWWPGRAEAPADGAWAVAFGRRWPAADVNEATSAMRASATASTAHHRGRSPLFGRPSPRAVARPSPSTPEF
jgi:hypothetical protein